MNSKVRAYFELLRFPAVFTAVSNVTMGYLITHGDLRPWTTFALLAASSASIYLAGMVLNDAFDADIDATERPGRPIPSGRISRATAYRLGAALIVAGLLAAWMIVAVEHDFGPISIATVLAYFVYLYDRLLKHRSIGPWVMGFCRSLNVLLGMSTVGAGQGRPLSTLWTASQLAAPAAIGIYIVAVTLISRREANSASVQVLIRYLLRGLVVIDAAIVFAFCGLSWSGAVLALLIPMLLLEHWASTT